MFLKTEFIAAKKLIGKRMSMSLSDNQTFALWRSFMPLRKTILNNLNADLISMQVYNGTFDWNPETVFEKWAAVAVSDFEVVPDGMETFLLPEGLYAVFHHKGAAVTASETFRYIFGTWLPESEYTLDHRPHFEILGEKYKNNDPESEEEIWIPIRRIISNN